MRTTFYAYDARNPERAYTCDLCGKAFQDGDEIARQAGTYHLACWEELFADIEQHVAEDVALPFQPKRTTQVMARMHHMGRYQPKEPQ